MDIMDIANDDIKVANETILYAAYFDFPFYIDDLFDCKHVPDINTRDVYGNTPLIVAASKGHSNFISKLFKKPGVDVNANNKIGWTALHESCFHGFDNITDQLLGKSDINPNARTKDDESVLDFAIYGTYSKCIKKLVSSGARYHRVSPVDLRKSAIGGAIIKGIQLLQDDCGSHINCIKKEIAGGTGQGML